MMVILQKKFHRLDSEGNRIRHVMPESYDPQTDDGEGFTYTYDAFSFSKSVLIALTNV